jgi:hypothetical protein
MTALIVTDVRKSGCNSDMDLITFVLLSGEHSDAHYASRVAMKDSQDLLALESATADVELPALGIHKGDQFIRMWASPDHGIRVGEEIFLEEKGDLILEK